ncbi:hypothetical protein Hbl1158_08665 [Halobaculum sp. CBA1158]|uniref:hypothetical protein n=1 Tax=Halobaculum sp. CBA1158 TaxID=2904243 RepID=UPI001F332EE2|nr:hypothetical protein [Halobaculum sp. CBA1158]UIO98628.1 hypothetical protein Hbl1158_08665 [Halobaculum sp. CBA1158]
MTGASPTAAVITVLLALAGAGVAFAAGIGLVAVHVRVGDDDERSAAATRTAFGVWAVGAVLLAAGTPAVLRSTIADAPTLRVAAVVAVAVGLVAVTAAPLYRWRATLERE